MLQNKQCYDRSYKVENRKELYSIESLACGISNAWEVIKNLYD